MLRLILSYLLAHRTSMGTKMALSFANIFMVEVETDIINQSPYKALISKRYIKNRHLFSMEHKQRSNKPLHRATK